MLLHAISAGRSSEQLSVTTIAAGGSSMVVGSFIVFQTTATSPERAYDADVEMNEPHATGVQIIRN